MMMNRRAASLATLALATTSLACSRPGDTPREAPLRLVLACASASACDADARRAAFDGWVQRAIDLPGSSLDVWSLGTDGAPRRTAALCVPLAWHGPARAAMTGFTVRGRALATAQPGAVRDAIPAEDCARADEQGADLALIDERGHLARSSVAAELGASHQAVVCDLSTSMTNARVCSADRVTRVFDAWASRPGALAPGASFELAVVGTRRDTVRETFAMRTPPAPLGARALSLVAARARLVRTFPQADGATGSAIAEAIDWEARRLHDARGDRFLTVLSDLREVGGPWNFESRPVPAPLFAEQLRSKGLLPDLARMHVTVCSHQQAGSGAPEVSARSAATVENAWRDVLAKAGAPAAPVLVDCDARLAQRE